MAQLPLQFNGKLQGHSEKPQFAFRILLFGFRFQLQLPIFQEHQSGKKIGRVARWFKFEIQLWDHLFTIELESLQQTWQFMVIFSGGNFDQFLVTDLSSSEVQHPFIFSTWPKKSMANREEIVPTYWLETWPCCPSASSTSQYYRNDNTLPSAQLSRNSSVGSSPS